jgi:hypothetical protein
MLLELGVIVFPHNGISEANPPAPPYIHVERAG